MTNAVRDQNNVPVMIGISSTDGSTILPVYANPTSHIVQVSDAATGSDLTGDNALRDENYVSTMLAVSDVDGVTPVPIYVNTSNQLLVKST